MAPKRKKKSNADSDELRSNRELCKQMEYDIEIIVEGKSFPCHRAVLASACEFFRSMLGPNFQESKVSQIHLPNLKKDGFEELVNVMYGRKIELTFHNVSNLFIASNYLGLQYLEDMCTAFLEYRSPMSNASEVEVFVLACSMKNERIIKTLSKHIAEYFIKLFQEDAFYSIPTEQLIAILESEYLPRSAEAKADFLVKWTKTHPDNEDIQKFLKILDPEASQMFKAKLSVPTVDNSRSVCRNDEGTVADAVGDAADNSCNAEKIIIYTSDVTYYPIDNKQNEYTYINTYTITKNRDTHFNRNVNIRETPQIKCKTVSVEGLYFTYTTSKKEVGYRELTYEYEHRFYLAKDNVETELAQPKSKNFRNIAITGVQPKIYVYTSSQEASVESALFSVYNCCTDQWLSVPTNKANFIPVINPNLASVDGNLYLVSGREATPTSVSNSMVYGGYFQRYDLRADKWNRLPDSTYTHTNGAVCVYDGKLYVSGGDCLTYYKAVTEVFDITAGKWNVLAPMPQMKRNHNLVACDKYLWAVGGTKDGFKITEPDLTICIYNTSNNTWSAPFSVPIQCGTKKITKILDAIV